MNVSKLKVRRGLKVNLPVLDEGEFGLCTDTEELYIGSPGGNILHPNQSKWDELKTLIDGANGDIDTLFTDVSEIRTDFTAADTALSEEITTVRTDFTNADTELDTKISTVRTDFTNADTALDDKIGPLTDLTTKDKTNLVAAVNETVSSLAETAQQQSKFNRNLFNTNLSYNKERRTVNLNRVTGSDLQEYPWTVPNASDGAWVVSNNAIKPTYTTAAKNGTFAFYKNDTIQDGKISTIIDGWNIVTTTSYLGITFRVYDQNDFLCAIFQNQTKAVSILRRQNGVTSQIATVDVSTHPSLSAAGEPILLSVEFVGGNIKVYMNNALVLTVSEDVAIRKQATAGLFGLVLVCSGSVTLNQNVTFSSLVYEKYNFNKINASLLNVLSAGDSVTYGSLSSTPAKSYIGLLRSYLQSKMPDLTLDNFGTPGNNTNSVKYQVINNIKLKPYQIVTIMSGINDSRIDSAGLTLDVSIENTREMIRVCKENGAIPILLLPNEIHPAVNTSTLNRSSWVYLKRLVNMQRDLAAKENIICVDTNTALDLATDYADVNVHPNDGGHQKIFDIIKSSVFTFG